MNENILSFPVGIVNRLEFVQLNKPADSLLSFSSKASTKGRDFLDKISYQDFVCTPNSLDKC